jgi:hypothetical protein
MRAPPLAMLISGPTFARPAARGFTQIKNFVSPDGGTSVTGGAIPCSSGIAAAKPGMISS